MMSCPICGAELQATTKIHWAKRGDRAWEIVDLTNEEISVYCNNDHTGSEMQDAIHASLTTEVATAVDDFTDWLGAIVGTNPPLIDVETIRVHQGRG